MAAEVKILIEGESNANEVGETGEEKTRATITLVREGNFAMVVDPGILRNQQILIDALEKEGLRPEDIDVVCITHSHIDHFRNIGIFPRAKVLEHYGLWDKESVKDWPEQFSIYIQILHTPGHDKTGITIFAKTEEGVVAICGDVFWKENYPESPKDDTYASDPEELAESRKLVLEMADWIIPGHGGMYKVKKGLVETIKTSVIGTKNIKIKTLAGCKNCHTPIQSKKDVCICRPWLCYRCCKCEIDCNTCNCSHRNK